MAQGQESPISIYTNSRSSASAAATGKGEGEGERNPGNMFSGGFLFEGIFVKKKVTLQQHFGVWCAKVHPSEFEIIVHNSPELKGNGNNATPW